MALGGGTIPIRDAGYFMFDLNSHNGFWPAGSIQVDTWLAHSPQTKSTNNIIIVARNPPAPLLPIKLPKPSNVIVDSSKNKHIVPMGKSFRIRGKTTDANPNPLTPLEGPHVIIGILDQRNITHNSGSARSLKSEDGTYWFEVETVAPNIPGEYKLRLRIQRALSKEAEVRFMELTVALPSDET
ncbi:MAG: hypothetical protein HZA46_25040 [Planctomycetales bacterium]|nr:hypothetical protein [Planctomycetales bacterium]